MADLSKLSDEQLDALIESHASKTKSPEAPPPSTKASEPSILGQLAQGYQDHLAIPARKAIGLPGTGNEAISKLLPKDVQEKLPLPNWAQQTLNKSNSPLTILANKVIGNKTVGQLGSQAYEQIVDPLMAAGALVKGVGKLRNLGEAGEAVGSWAGGPVTSEKIERLISLAEDSPRKTVGVAGKTYTVDQLKNLPTVEAASEIVGSAENPLIRRAAFFRKMAQNAGKYAGEEVGGRMGSVIPLPRSIQIGTKFGGAIGEKAATAATSPETMNFLMSALNPAVDSVVLNGAKTLSPIQRRRNRK